MVMMKIKTLVVAPYPGLVELTSGLQAELKDFDIRIVQGDLSEVLPLLNRIHQEGYDLIISRGGTARLLRQHSYLPVIEIQVSGFDMMRILMVIKGYQSKVKMIGFPNIIEGFVSVSSLMGVEIPCTAVQHESEVDGVLRLAKAEGVAIIIGDSITVRKAAEYGMQGVLITSGRESVLEAFAHAKQIYRVSERYKKQKQAYETLLNKMEIGYAIVDADGMVQFANETFRSGFELLDDQSSLFQEYPDFKRYIEDLDRGIELKLLMKSGPEREYALYGGLISDSQPKRIYYLKVMAADRMEDGITMSYTGKMDNSFPQLILTDNAGEEPNGELLRVAVYGERGVGKRLYAMKRWGSNPYGGGDMLELDIARCDEASLRMLTTLIETGRKDQMIYIRGVENLSMKDQKGITPVLLQSPSQIIFSFERNPADLKAENALNGKLYESFQERIVFLPPLNESLDKLDEYIRTFLIMYNERYGKQIVGLRQEVMDALYVHPWHGNLFELKEMIGNFVKHSDGEYIGKDVLHLMQQDDGDPPNEPAGRGGFSGMVDLNKTLEEIERDVIQAVLERENMNLTAAAKRLGINRSTLWRKIKQ